MMLPTFHSPRLTTEFEMAAASTLSWCGEALLLDGGGAPRREPSRSVSMQPYPPHRAESTPTYPPLASDNKPVD